MSEEEQYDLFCTQCGQRISKDTVFCPSCGAQVSDPAAGQTSDQHPYVDSTYRPDRSSRLKGLGILFAISAALFLILGIFYYSSIDSLISELTKDPSWADLVKQVEDLGYTEQWLLDTIKQYLQIFAIMTIVAGVALAASAVCAFTRKLWVVGLIGCIIATLTSVTTLFGLIFGIIITYMYCTTKSSFQS